MTENKIPREPNAPWYIKVFLVLHVFAITVWALPNPPEGIDPDLVPENGQKAKPMGSDHILIWNKQHLKSNPTIYAYLFVTGFWQYWDMFAPNPSNTDFWADADVIYRDGSKRHYLYPRIYLLPIPSKIPSERYRKFFERANSDDYSYLWPQFALRIAYLNDNPSNPPVTVRLTRHWREVAAPGHPQATDYNSYMYFEYAVDQHRLQMMREGR